MKSIFQYFGNNSQQVNKQFIKVCRNEYSMPKCKNGDFKKCRHNC